MPTVLLTTYECRTGLLPRLCAKCGEPTDDGIPLPSLTPVPSLLLNVFLIVCPPVFVGLAIAIRRGATFDLPLCKPDKADWQWRDRVSSWTCVALVCGAYVTAPIVGYLTVSAADPLNGIVMGFIVYYLIWVVWWMPIAVMWTRTVRTSKVTYQGIRLSGVCKEFVTAIREDRAQDPNPARLPWGGTVRDDYDDPTE